MEVLNSSFSDSNSPKDQIACSTPRPENDAEFQCAQMLNKLITKTMSEPSFEKNMHTSQELPAAAVPPIDLSKSRTMEQCYRALAFLDITYTRYNKHETIKNEIVKTLRFISILDPSFNKHNCDILPLSARKSPSRKNRWDKYKLLLIDAQEQQNLSESEHINCIKPKTTKLDLTPLHKKKRTQYQPKCSQLLMISKDEASTLLEKLENKCNVTNVYAGQVEYLQAAYQLIDPLWVKTFPQQKKVSSSPRLLIHVLKKRGSKKKNDVEIEKEKEKTNALGQLLPIFDLLSHSYALETNRPTRTIIAHYILKACEILSHFEQRGYAIVLSKKMRTHVDRCYVIAESTKTPRCNDKQSQHIASMQATFLETGRKLLKEEKRFSETKKVEIRHNTLWHNQNEINLHSFEKVAIKLLKRTKRADDLIKISGMIHNFPALLNNTEIQALISETQKRLKKEAQRARVMQSPKKQRGKIA